ncbi:Replication factor A protein 1 [Nakaseomyces bracarensis]|uniref:Replication protein A subunit n=1 Tax=Nakaseomyces bracarensis TaxID=273131 RepID=A0ABR4NS39_9SACH
MTDLTKGDFVAIFTDQQRYQDPSGGVYQVINIRKADPNKPNKKFLIMISDGVYHMKALFKGDAIPKLHNLNIDRGDVIKTLRVEPLLIKEKKLVLVIEDFEMVKSGAEVVDTNTQFLDTALANRLNEVIAARKDPNSPHPQLPTDNSNNNNNNNSTLGAPSSAAAIAAASTNSSNAQRFNESSSQKSRPIFAIEQLSPYQNVWTIKARVSYKGDIKTWHNQRGEGKLLNVNFLDTSGEIRATAFNDNATAFNEILQEGKVYYVSKARLQPAKPQFTNLSHPYELSLDRETVIEESFDEKNVPKTHFNFIKLNNIQAQENNSNVDVLGVIQTVNPHFELTSRAGKKFDRRDIQIVDDSGFSISVGLWNQQALDFNLPEGSVIAIKGVRVSDFGGKSLSMGFNSTLIANPEIPEAYTLKGWYDQQGKDQDFTSLKQDPGAGPSAGNLAKFIGQRITIARAEAENLGKSERGDFFSVKAAISFMKVDNFAYPACSNENCNKKVIEQPDGTWRCEKCDINNPSPRWRYILTISIIDETDNLWLTLFDDQAKQLLGVDANTLMSLKENDPDEFTRTTQSVQMNQYDFRIRAREDNYNDQTRIRYTVANLHKLNFKAEADYLAEELTKALLN